MTPVCSEDITDEESRVMDRGRSNGEGKRVDMVINVKQYCDTLFDTDIMISVQEID